MKTAPVKKESKNTKKSFVNIYVNNTDKELFLMYSEKRDKIGRASCRERV